VVIVALCCAAGLSLWPDRDALRRLRVTTVLGRRAPTWRVAAGRAVPLPPAVAAIAALGGAVVSTPLVAALVGAAAFVGARAWLSARAGRGTEGRLLALADGLGALAAELRSGRSLEQATAAAATACADEECGRALAAVLRAPGNHVGHDDPVLSDALARIAAAVRLSGRTGCSLAAVAGAVEDDLRARHRLQLELRTATAAPQASAALLAGLPVMGLAMGHGIGADPWGVLTGTAVGQVLLVAGVALEGAGLAWSRRLVARAVRP
jgi:tight adherence protein B